jgi:hypothetical protein
MVIRLSPGEEIGNDVFLVGKRGGRGGVLEGCVDVEAGQSLTLLYEV